MLKSGEKLRRECIGNMKNKYIGVTKEIAMICIIIGHLGDSSVD